MDAAKLSRKYEAMVRTTAGGLHDEKRVVNALLEAADQLDRASLATLLSAENLRLRIKAKGRDKDKRKDQEIQQNLQGYKHMGGKSCMSLYASSPRVMQDCVPPL